ncbi:MAG: DUF424 family protein [Candidatus Aenigmarchaeota archaeon]|nr:DUF424 family protein [Candidatus Aenigmarchaeota archaeon]
MTYSLKIHDSGKGSIVAICDSDILGCVFVENDFILDIDEDFFGGDIVDNDKILVLIKSAHTVNACGNKIVEFLISENIIKTSHVKTIDNVKYAMIF